MNDLAREQTGHALEQRAETGMIQWGQPEEVVSSLALVAEGRRVYGELSCSSLLPFLHPSDAQSQLRLSGGCRSRSTRFGYLPSTFL